MLRLPTVQNAPLRNTLGLAFALVCVGALAASGQWWWLQAHTFPPDILLIAMATVAVGCAFCEKDKSGFVLPALGTLLMLGMYCTYYVVPLGDHWASAVENELRTGTLYQSSLLGTLVLYWTDILNMPLSWVAPLFGATTTFLTLYTLQNIVSAHDERRYVSPLMALLFLGSGIPLLFFRGYVEMTFLGFPWFLAFIFCSHRYFQSSEISLWWASGAAAALTLAALTHGQFTFLLPLLPLLPWLKRGRVEWNVWKEWLVIVVCIIGTAAAVIGSLQFAGFHLYTGDINGGGDGERFVPLWEISGRATFTMFSWDHLWQLMNIVVLVTPLSLSVPWLLLHKPQHHEHTALTRLLGVATLGYLSFITLWNFDLGFPTDYDLMISMGLTMVLWLACLITERYERLPNVWLWMMVIGALLWNWSFIALFLKL